MRKIPFSIIKRLNKWFRPEFSLVSRQGLRWVLDKNNWIDNRLLSFRGYEDINLKLMKRIVNLNSFDYIFDIGANIGFFTCHLAKQKNVKNVHAFEPMVRNYNQLCANILVNNLSSVAEAHPLALSDTNGETTIHFNDESTGIATLNPDETVRSADDYTRSETIQTVRFDDVFPILAQTCFIKMDVEQHEIAALSGMKDFFKNNKVCIILEINRENEDLKMLLQELGLNKLNVQTDSDDYLFANFDVKLPS